MLINTLKLCIGSIVFVLFAISCTSLVIKGPITIFDRNGEVANSVSYDGTHAGPYRLSCNYTLELNEIATQLHWVLDSFRSQRQGEFTWSSKDPPSAEGLLSDAVNLERKDGQLEIKEPTYDLWGEYTCTVYTSKNASVTNGPQEVTILDSDGIANDASDYVLPCYVQKSFKSATIFPPPTIESGIYSPSIGDFVVKVENYQWTHYSNGSRSASFEDFKYRVVEDSPTDFYFLNKIFITQRDGKIIPIGSITTRGNPNDYKTRGCNELKLDKKFYPYYSTKDRIPCKNQLPSFSLLTVYCRQEKDRKSNTTAVYVCSDQTHEWALRSQSAPEDLGCVIPSLLKSAASALLFGREKELTLGVMAMSFFLTQRIGGI